MPRKSFEDHKNTREYIPMISHEYRTPIKEKLRDLESRYIHEGQVRVSLPIDGDLMSWHMVSLRMVHIKPTFLPLRTSFRLFELIEMVKVRRIRLDEEENVVLEYQVLTRKPEEGICGYEKTVVIPFFFRLRFNHPHLIFNDDDDVGITRDLGPSTLLLFVIIITTTPSPTTTSSSPTPPNAPSKTTSTNQTSSSQENTSSSFHSKLQISPPSSHEPTSPHHLNPLLDNISDVPPRPLNPQPLQSHPSLDITLSLSPITPLDHIHDTPSPPSPPQPQPPIMGHPLFYNYHDYHGSTCICCSHNRNLFFTLRDEMNIMFAHLEYLLTTAITSHFPPPP
ncbi:hypothetical protein Tco_0565799 [Tanacetum coccineum]